MRLAALFGCVLLLGSCAIGKNVKREETAISARGAQGWVEAGRRRYEGELLMVTDSSIALQLLASQRLLEIAARQIERFDFHPFASGGPLRVDELRVLTTASRFPYGIPDAALATLLQRANQTMIDRIE